MRILATLVVLVSLFPVNAFAWGPDGHRIVCRIAFLLLDDSEKQEVIRLTDAYERPDGKPTKFFTDGCIFPDEARAKASKPGWEHFKRFNNQHFVNLPRTSDTLTEDDCNNDCVLTGIATQSAALKSGADDQARAEALFFLGHFVGDVHQPLHVSFADDKGGNAIKPIRGGVYRSGSLHSVWDSGILVVAIGNRGWRIFGESLIDDITDAQKTEWLSNAPIDWANESLAITTRKDVDYCEPSADKCRKEPGPRTLRRSYQNKHDDRVEMRLRAGGVRLANEIRKALE
ncbi:MAG TPA: S1/P1 nuclease [Thermoanaerobaculia bacterium]|nr:S1/P1 nuclease [Thermoanaerobaculia bacterium]